MFGDASGEGFGSTYMEPSSGTIHFRYGIWGVEGKDTSSNYQELKNLVETLEEMGLAGTLEGREVLIFTDNMVSESVAANGTSSSPELFKLVVRIFKLEMRHKCKVQFIHVAGTCMILQGADGLSRGDMYEGVMKGDSILSFVPLHRNAIDRHPPLLDWIESWACSGGNDVELLSPEGRFERGHDMLGSGNNLDNIWIPSYKKGTFIWSSALKGKGDSDLAISNVLVLLVDIARHVDNQATSEGARDELMKSSSEYVKSELFDVNIMLGALEGEISGLETPNGLKN